jgi:hypothetical protein
MRRISVGSREFHVHTEREVGVLWRHLLARAEGEIQMMDWFQSLENVEGMEDHQLMALDSELNKHLSIVRYATILVLVLVIGGMLYSMYNTVNSIDQNALAKAAEAQVAVLLPQLQRAAVEVGNEVSPSVATAFTKEAEKLAGDLEKSLDKEIAALQKSLPLKMEVTLLREMEKARVQQKGLLLAKFPTLKAQPEKLDKLFASFEAGTTKWAGLVLARVFERHLAELNKLRQTLDTFVAKKNAADAKAGKNEAVDGEQVLNVWLEILDETFAGEGEAIVIEEKAPKKK